MPVVILFACLDLEQKSSFMDGHYFYDFILKKFPGPLRCIGVAENEAAEPE